MPKIKDEGDDGPERTCIVTRRKADPDSMIRFVLGPNAAVVPDVRRKLPGRGVWVSASSSIVTEAIKKQAFSRGFKTKAAVSPNLAAETDDLLARDCLQALSMANKAGVVVAGFAKVESAIATGKVGALLHATDGGDDGARKIDGAARRQRQQKAADEAGIQAREVIAGGPGHPFSIKLFSSEQLDLALGRTNVIHASLAVGPASKAFLTRCRRLMLYRSEALPELGADAEAEPRSSA